MRLPKLTWIYCLYSDAFPFRYKIGITERQVSQRIHEIEYSIKEQTGTPVKVGRFVQVPSFFAYKLEQFLHARFAKYNVPTPGSGKTEWFMWRNQAVGFMFLCLMYYYKWDISPAWAAVLILIHRPLDFALLLILALCVEAVAVVGGLILLFTFLNSLIN